MSPGASLLGKVFDDTPGQSRGRFLDPLAAKVIIAKSWKTKGPFGQKALDALHGFGRPPLWGLSSTMNALFSLMEGAARVLVDDCVRAFVPV